MLYVRLALTQLACSHVMAAADAAADDDDVGLAECF